MTDMTKYGYKSMMLLLDRENHLRMIRSGKQEGMIRQEFEGLFVVRDKVFDKVIVNRPSLSLQNIKGF